MPYVRGRGTSRAFFRDRPWFLLGGSGLAAMAGFINVCVLSFTVVPASHVTGAVSQLSADVFSGGGEAFTLMVTAVAAFLAGGVASGAIIGSTHLKPGRRYGVVLMAEGVLLALATVLLMQRSGLGVAMAAAACGMQNAMASSYYGLVVRTTHMTGIVTDIGVLIGHWLRYRRASLWKLGFLTALLVSFFGGGVFAAIAVRGIGVAALALPAIACVAAGATYYTWRHRLLEKAQLQKQPARPARKISASAPVD